MVNPFQKLAKLIYKHNLSDRLFTVSRLIFSYRNLWIMIIISQKPERKKEGKKTSRKLYNLKKLKNETVPKVLYSMSLCKLH